VVKFITWTSITLGRKLAHTFDLWQCILTVMCLKVVNFYCANNYRQRQVQHEKTSAIILPIWWVTQNTKVCIVASLFYISFSVLHFLINNCCFFNWRFSQELQLQYDKKCKTSRCNLHRGGNFEVWKVWMLFNFIYAHRECAVEKFTTYLVKCVTASCEDAVEVCGYRFVKFQTFFRKNPP
jgi:hypothetical protein